MHTQARTDTETGLVLARVTGDDIAEVVAAAKLVEAAILVTRRGRYYFQIPTTQFPILRESHGLGQMDFAAWLWWVRPRAKYFLPGAQGVNFTYDPESGGDGSGDIPSDEGMSQPGSDVGESDTKPDVPPVSDSPGGTTGGS